MNAFTSPNFSNQRFSYLLHEALNKYTRELLFDADADVDDDSDDLFETSFAEAILFCDRFTCNGTTSSFGDLIIFRVFFARNRTTSLGEVVNCRNFLARRRRASSLRLLRCCCFLRTPI